MMTLTTSKVGEAVSNRSQKRSQDHTRSVCDRFEGGPGQGRQHGTRTSDPRHPAEPRTLSAEWRGPCPKPSNSTATDP
jgi:hypothetical protein